jgi:DNA-binding CsgD family transcriptional regulator
VRRLLDLQRDDLVAAVDRFSEEVVLLLGDLLDGPAGPRLPDVTAVTAGRFASAAADARAAAVHELLEIRPRGEHGTHGDGGAGAPAHRVIFAGRSAGSGADTTCGVGSEHVVYHVECPRLVVVDHTLAVMSIGGTALDGIVIVDGPLVSMLRSYFEALWTRSARCGGAPAGDDAVSPVTARVLTLLSNGHRDVAAARALGLSVRTVRRHVAQIAHRLNTMTRFATGYHAYRKDWLGSR